MSNKTGDGGFALVAARHAMSSSEGGSENYGALPSSYRRRVRKSRSIAAIQPNNLRLRLQRSVPFLRRRSTTTFHRSIEAPWQRHEEAVQLARAQYFSGSEDQDLQTIEQYGPRKINWGEHRAFRKSVRGADIPHENILSVTKRSSSFSTTLRNRVRKVITRTFSRKDSLPPQQLEAQRNYYSDAGPEDGLISDSDTNPVSREILRNPPKYPPNLENKPPDDLIRFGYNVTSAASRESVHSNARSRVTSWTDSSRTGSIDAHSAPIERHRLSIIKEDIGPSLPSSSAGKHTDDVELSQEPSQSVMNHDLGAPALDSRRIYSALMKRMEEEEAEVERTRLAVEILRNEREESNTEVLESKTTIRAVYSDSSSANLPMDYNKRQMSSHSGSLNIDHPTGATSIDIEHKRNSNRRRDRLVEQEPQSSFFPYSSEKSPDTPSPFKRFLHERRDRTRSRSRSRSSDKSRVHQPDFGSVTINRQPSNQVMNRPRFCLSSGSVYSRTTNGGSNEQYRHPVDSSEELTTTQLVRPEPIRKENSPIPRDGSPPISTPDRLHLRSRNGCSTGRLRKRASEIAIPTRNGVYTTPQDSISTTPSRPHESPTEIAKKHLAARLSRPFNMDIPPLNRPFDSMYLGKRTIGHPDTFGNNRLSVSPEGLNESNYRVAEENKMTALPSSSFSAGKSATRMFGLLGSKRMVSNFLKSRRKDRSTSTAEREASDEDPAFI